MQNPLLSPDTGEWVHMLWVFLSRGAFICNAKEMIFFFKLNAVVEKAHKGFNFKTSVGPSRQPMFVCSSCSAIYDLLAKSAAA